MIMTKEEILEKSRNESKGGDYFEGEVIRWASQYSMISGWVFCLLITLLDLICGKPYNPAAFIVCFGMSFVMFLLKSIKLKKKHEIVTAVLYGVLVVLNICVYIIKGFAA